MNFLTLHNGERTVETYFSRTETGTRLVLADVGQSGNVDGVARKPVNTLAPYLYHVWNRPGGSRRFKTMKFHAAFERLMLEAHRRPALPCQYWNWRPGRRYGWRCYRAQ